MDLQISVRVWFCVHHILLQMAAVYAVMHDSDVPARSIVSEASLTCVLACSFARLACTHMLRCCRQNFTHCCCLMHCVEHCAHVIASIPHHLSVTPLYIYLCAQAVVWESLSWAFAGKSAVIAAVQKDLCGTIDLPSGGLGAAVTSGDVFFHSFGALPPTLKVDFHLGRKVWHIVTSCISKVHGERSSCVHVRTAQARCDALKSTYWFASSQCST